MTCACPVITLSPRDYDAVLFDLEAFLASRGIELPLGAAEDGPEVQSVHALGNLKDKQGEDMPEIRDWRWGARRAG